nr:formate--tetrahydrofolate ligase [Lachnospiraceae bacterium]
WGKGGEGGMELAEKVLYTLENKKSALSLTYRDDEPIRDKIEAVAKKIYGAGRVEISPAVQKQIERLEKLGYGKLPVCIAKTQYSFSDDPSLLGRPQDYTMTVREVYVSAGAGFVVVIMGSIMTMPGLPKVPAAYGIDVTPEGRITGLF